MRRTDGLFLVLKYSADDIGLDAVDAVVCATEDVARRYQQIWNERGYETDLDLIRIRTECELVPSKAA
jgi:hypothetical protein